MKLLFGIWVSVVITAIIGWVMNIFAILATQDILGSTTGVLRIVGIFLAPLGAIMGLFVG